MSQEEKREKGISKTIKKRNIKILLLQVKYFTLFFPLIHISNIFKIKMNFKITSKNPTTYF
jgi:hypothetical protein